LRAVGIAGFSFIVADFSYGRMEGDSIWKQAVPLDDDCGTTRGVTL
jgi:hypothetical protein